MRRGQDRSRARVWRRGARNGHDWPRGQLRQGSSADSSTVREGHHAVAARSGSAGGPPMTLCYPQPAFPLSQSEKTVAMTAGQTAAPGLNGLRAAPEGLPDPNIQPPTVAEAGDPFTDLRVIDLVARIERGRPVRIADLVAQLNATYLDWIFEPSVVADALLQLTANWMTDYRNVAGIL